MDRLTIVSCRIIVEERTELLHTSTVVLNIGDGIGKNAKTHEGIEDSYGSKTHLPTQVTHNNNNTSQDDDE